MKSLILILIGLCMCNISWAQQQEDLKKIEAARIGLISERLGLSPEQAEKFWPLYNEYTEKRKEFRKELTNARQNIDLNTASEEDKRKLIDLGLKFKEMDLAIEKDYSEKLLTVISSQQLLRLRNAEEDFREMLLQRIQQQRGQRQDDPKRGMPQERVEKRRNN